MFNVRFGDYLCICYRDCHLFLYLAHSPGHRQDWYIDPQPNDRESFPRYASKVTNLQVTNIWSGNQMYSAFQVWCLSLPSLYLVPTFKTVEQR